MLSAMTSDGEVTVTTTEEVPQEAPAQAAEQETRTRLRGADNRDNLVGLSMEHYSIEQMIAALQACKGIKSQAARRLGCTTATINNYVRRYPEIAQACIDAREELVDHAEIALMKMVRDGEWNAVRFVLTTMGKQRGWQERTDVNARVSMGNASMGLGVYGGRPDQDASGPDAPTIREIVVHRPPAVPFVDPEGAREEIENRRYPEADQEIDAIFEPRPDALDLMTADGNGHEDT